MGLDHLTWSQRCPQTYNPMGSIQRSPSRSAAAARGSQYLTRCLTWGALSAKLNETALWGHISQELHGLTTWTFAHELKKHFESTYKKLLLARKYYVAEHRVNMSPRRVYTGEKKCMSNSWFREMATRVALCIALSSCPTNTEPCEKLNGMATLRPKMSRTTWNQSMKIHT